MSPESFDFEKLEREMRKKRDIAHQELFKYLPTKEPFAHYEMVKEYSLRKGKGFRAALCFFGCEGFGGKLRKAVKTAAAFQASQDWILIHDDIEDESSKRRGRLTLHKMYNAPFAINAGDSLHIIMWKIFIDNKKVLGADLALKIMEEMHKILTVTTEGQYIELSWIDKKRFDITEVEYYEMTRRKTGIYTVVGPLKLGALISEKATAKDTKAIEEFGSLVGIAFQIRDDILNLTGKEDNLGKKNAEDIKEGKRTLILIHLLRNCNEKEKENVIQIYNKKRKSTKDVKYVWQLMNRYGSIDYTQHKGEDLVKRAKTVFDKKLAKRLDESVAKECISQAIEWVINRKR